MRIHKTSRIIEELDRAVSEGLHQGLECWV